VTALSGISWPVTALSGISWPVTALSGISVRFGSLVVFQLYH